jgi:hypothetical protein
MTVRRNWIGIGACLTILLALTECLSACGAAVPAGSTPTSPTASVAAPSAEATVPPQEKSDLPDGTYRTQLTKETLQKLGSGDVSSAGVWTLTIASGTFQLDCIDLDDPGIDCGNTGSTDRKSPAVEMGDLYGTAPTVWIMHDMKRLSKVNGCDPNDCGPVGAYHMDWQVNPTGLTFSRFVGLGDQVGLDHAEWVAQPWTKIS